MNLYNSDIWSEPKLAPTGRVALDITKLVATHSVLAYHETLLSVLWPPSSV